MLRSFSSALSRHAAFAVLVALVVSAFGPLLHGVHQDDCDPAYSWASTGGPTARGTSTADEGAPLGDHCVACHFARASRGGLAWVVVSPQLLDHSGPLHIIADQPFRSFTDTPVPARAPPA